MAQSYGSTVFELELFEKIVLVENQDCQTTNKGKTGENRRRKVMGLMFRSLAKGWLPDFRRVQVAPFTAIRDFSNGGDFF